MKNTGDKELANAVVRVLAQQQEKPVSYQVVMRMPNPERLITAGINFPCPDEAFEWGRLAADVMKFFVHVDAWKVVNSTEPPTHTLQNGHVVLLDSSYRQ